MSQFPVFYFLPHSLRHAPTKFGRRAFSVAACNSLSDYLHDPSLSQDTFRRSL